MFYPPKTLEEAKKYRYRKWSGCPKGTPYESGKCAYEVADSNYLSPLFHQCSKKNGHGPEGLYCKIHAKMVGK